ncbi:hypothetical protein DUZ99_07720 [Xylanibacillus composti]|uniref:MFS transporter n=1 Tax=Xylanibacillus composti TaxID=1572762 RepID=A0A8J4GZM7_9BACL|nr:hypothetical protein [Xylanibacillus composti]MDT9724881.1 hypothetical protein [Xylanibacillus composti]GIQ68114.1 hypothetical protein XYCOK13_09380 [Xylanibacillus composti]
MSKSFVGLAIGSALGPIVAAILVLGQVGQTVIKLAMANSVSQTLSPEHSGAGMGLLSLMNFISGGIATGVYGKLIDLGADQHWNPLHLFGVGSLYSNLFLLLAVLHGVCWPSI